MTRALYVLTGVVAVLTLCLAATVAMDIVATAKGCHP